MGLIIATIFSQVQSSSRILSSDIIKITWSDWLIMIGLALSGVLAYTSITQALKLISPNLVASLRTLELVLAYVAQTLITGEYPDLWSCFGGGLILIGVLILTFEDRISEMFLWRPFLPHVYLRRLSQTLPFQYTHHGFDEY